VWGPAHAILSLLFPEGCPLCEQPLDEGCRAGVCSACWGEVRPSAGSRCLRCGFPYGPCGKGEGPLCLSCARRAPAYDAGISFGAYAGRLAAVLRLLKYGGMPGIAGPLADAILAHRPCADFLHGAQLLVPVPLHPRRRRERGHDQAVELARALGLRLRLPVAEALRRVRATPPQVGLAALERRSNLRGAFAARRDSRGLSGRVVCLVDDVWTTGSTLEEAARALRAAGPAAVLAFSAARAL